VRPATSPIFQGWLGKISNDLTMTKTNTEAETVLLLLKTHRIESLVSAVWFVDEFIVRTKLENTAVGNQRDSVCISNRGKSARNYNTSVLGTCHDLVHRRLDNRLGFIVDKMLGGPFVPSGVRIVGFDNTSKDIQSLLVGGAIYSMDFNL
jgi:hypothetical protein